MSIKTLRPFHKTKCNCCGTDVSTNVLHSAPRGDNRFPLDDLDLPFRTDVPLICMICMICMIYSSCCRLGAVQSARFRACFLGWICTTQTISSRRVRIYLKNHLDRHLSVSVTWYELLLRNSLGHKYNRDVTRKKYRYNNGPHVRKI